MTEIIKEAITIPSWNLDRLQHEVDKLNRRAAKLGLAPFSFTYETRTIKDPRYEDIHGYTLPDAPMIEVADVTFHGEGPKVEGWKFIGSLDHVTFPEDVLVKTVPGETIPEKYFHADSTCDHCGHKRNRKDTFVLENIETGETQQIGRQCVKDYIGHDPERIARLLSSFWSMVGSAEDDENFGIGSGHYEPTWNADEVLRYTIRSIKLYGWMSRGKAGEDDVPTSYRVSNVISRPWRMTKQEKEIWEAERALYDGVADVEREDAEIAKARAWLDEQEASNEYIHNLKAIAKMDFVPGRLFGFWTSMIAAYQRYADTLEEAARAKKVSEYVGEVGERMDMTVKVKRIGGFSSSYGWVSVVNMIDDEGRTIVWMANTNPNMNHGATYKIKATIKKHEIYKDWKQTHVSRVKVIEEVYSE